MTDDTVQQSTTTTYPQKQGGEGAFTEALPDTSTPQLAHFPDDLAEYKRNDLVILQQAIVKGWPLTAATKAKAIQAAELIRDTSKDPRLRLRAVEFLLSVDKHQLDVVKAFQPKDSPTTAVQVNVTGGSVDLSRLTDAELEARRAELVARTTKPPALPGG
jgi:hypothetical protein